MRRLVGWLQSRINGWDEICTNEGARLRTNNIFTTLMVTCISVFMMFLNIVQGNHSMALILVVLALLYGTMFLIQLLNPNYQRWAAWVFGIMAMAMCVFLLYLGGTGGLSYLWVLIVPHVAVMVVRLRDSLLYNAILLAAVVLELNSPLRQLLRYHYSDEFRILFPVVLVCIMGCIYLAEMVRIRTQTRLQATARQLTAFAFTDPLTGAYNRHALASHFGNINQASAEGLSFSVMDLDHFKNVNDTHGHIVGDEMLKHVVLCVREAIPANANLYRWGGEEFLLVLKTGDQPQARQVWEAVRRSVEGAPLVTEERQVPMTLSLGGVCAPADSTIHQCIGLADERLYRAKNSGRNRVVCDEEAT